MHLYQIVLTQHNSKTSSKAQFLDSPRNPQLSPLIRKSKDLSLKNQSKHHLFKKLYLQSPSREDPLPPVSSGGHLQRTWNGNYLLVPLPRKRRKLWDEKCPFDPAARIPNLIMLLDPKTGN
jgi:hypothetical protein